MKILSLNIEFGGYFLYERFGTFDYITNYVDLIKNRDIDIICFQESFVVGNKIDEPFDITKDIAKRLGYHHVNNPHAYIPVYSSIQT